MTVSTSIPPPLPRPQSTRLDVGSKVLIGLSVPPAVLVAALIVLRILGLVRPFLVPTGGMTPAVSAGDHVVMEGMTDLCIRDYRRGRWSILSGTLLTIWLLATAAALAFDIWVTYGRGA